jgi:hypothetical protein
MLILTNHVNPVKLISCKARKEKDTDLIYGALVCHCAANGNRHRQPKRWGREDHYRH